MIQIQRNVSAILLYFAFLSLLACSSADSSVPVEPPSPPEPPPVISPEEPPRPTLDAIEVLELKTYDGSGQVVHPDIAQTPERWMDRFGHMVITPYPYGSARDENPSVFLADNGLSWKVATGVINPIARPKTGGYLSDPDELYNPETRELWIYYRQVTNENQIYLIRSKDAVTWSDPVLIVSAPNHQIISPSIVRKGPGEWIMWSVNAGGVGCSGKSTTIELRRSRDGITWSQPEAVTMGHGDISPWHLNVEWIPYRNEFWAVYNGKTAGSCTTPVLFFATSQDGLRWKVFPKPLLESGVIPEFQDVVYRSTFLYDAYHDEVTFWYSGARYDNGRYVWRAAVQRMTRGKVFALAQSPKSAYVTQAHAKTYPQTRAGKSSGITYVPPLTDQTAP